MGSLVRVQQRPSIFEEDPVNDAGSFLLGVHRHNQEPEGTAVQGRLMAGAEPFFASGRPALATKDPTTGLEYFWPGSPIMYGGSMRQYEGSRFKCRVGWASIRTD